MHTSTDSSFFKNILNPYKNHENISINGSDFIVRYTNRAKQELTKRDNQLVVEMQIYFSCVVQKRILFHEHYDHETTPVGNNLSIAIRVIESDACDPDHYAKNHPEKRELKNNGAEKMGAKELMLDYKNKTWTGSFSIV